MSHNLRNFNLGRGPLKSTAPKRSALIVPITSLQEQELTQEQVLMNLPEVQPLMAVHGIQPFIRPDLVADLIDMYQWGGISHVIATLNLDDPDQTPAELLNELMLTYAEQGLAGLSESINEIRRIQPEVDLPTLEGIFREGAVTSLTELIQRSDPADPTSIIFNHPTQRLNQETEKVDIDMIRNEPEVAERFDMDPCECGSRKIRPRTVQHRGGDESWDIYATCVVCKRDWKVHT